MLKEESRLKWLFNKDNMPLTPTNMLLVHVITGRIKRNKQLINGLWSMSIRPGNLSWDCVIWVKKVLDELKVDRKT